jgi:hypothetical protein
MMSAAVVPAPAQVPSGATAPTGDHILTQVHVLEQYRPQLIGTVLDHRLLFPQFDRTGNGIEIVSVDPNSGAGIIVASGLDGMSTQHILFADSAATVVRDGGIVRVFNTATARERYRRRPVSWAGVSTATILGHELWMAGLRGGSTGHRPASLTFERYDLETGVTLFSHVPDPDDNPAPIPAPGRLAFWKDKLVAVSYGEVAIYNDRFEKMASAPAPQFEQPGDGCCCPVAEPKVYENRLIYGLNCRRIAVFDLDRLVLQHQFESPDYSGTRPLDAFGYSPSDVDGDKLFAVRSGNRSAVFDLKTGRLIALLPIDTSGIAVRGTNMAAYLGTPSYVRRQPIGIYHIDMGSLSGAPEKK